MVCVQRSSKTSRKYITSSRLTVLLMCFAVIGGNTIMFLYTTSEVHDRTTRKPLPFQEIIEAIFSNKDLPSFENEDIFSESLFKNDSFKPTWTWECKKVKKYSRCVRKSALKTSELQSLKTCNMICSERPIWPEPTGDYYFSKTVVPVELRSLALNILKSPSPKVSQYLQEAFEFLRRDIHKEATVTHDYETINMNADKKSLGIDVRVAVKGDDDPRLRLNTEEYYKLRMKSKGQTLVIKINAKSFCGARHGFETLSQLLWYDQYTKSVLAFKSAQVEDAPKFRYRGLLLDTARQFFPVADILRTIDAMAASKLNTFHWHATDSQSFPLKLKSVPQLALHGAYSLRQVYTSEDIKTIVHRARVRGIRVVIEVDAPAHVGRSWSWGNSSGLGHLAYCVEHDPWRGFCGEPPCGQLNPFNEHVYEILEKIYKEIIVLTGVDDVFHLGGDEVNPVCWRKFRKDNVLDEEMLESIDDWYLFTHKSTAALKNANNGKLPEMIILWSSKLTSESILSHMNKYTIQFWHQSEHQGTLDKLNTGIRTIISNLDNWYLDCGFGQWFESGVTCQPYKSWEILYNNRIWDSLYWNMVGGTTCMWTEQLAPEDIDARIWPRAAAVAERLWTDPPHEATADEYLRLDMHRARLVERGVRADVIWSRWCTENPYECKLLAIQ